MQKDIRNWVSQRLRKVSPQDLILNSMHKSVSTKKNLSLSIDFFSVPLSSGSGLGQLTVPLESAIAHDVLILLFHGLGNDRNFPLVHLIHEFNASGYSVLSVEWDGHGVNTSGVLDFQQATRSIPLILQRLYGDENQSGFGESREGPMCFLVGHSMGGAMSLIASSREDVSRVIQGVIAISPPIYIAKSSRFPFEFLNFMNFKAVFSDLWNKISLSLFMTLVLSGGGLKRKFFPLRMRIAIDSVEQARNFVFETFEKRRILRQVKSPVLWIHGMKDSIAPFKESSRLMMEIPSAFFSHSDRNRGHFRLSFSDQVAKYSVGFIKQCFILSKDKKEV